MNRYSSGGPSKATASTLCQKCLNRGHYSYECTAPRQERAYTKRPSRTEQLLNPKLVPKITSEPLKHAQPDAPYSHKRSPDEAVRPESAPGAKRARSASSRSDSVSTISTRSSQSPPPPAKRPVSHGKGAITRSPSDDSARPSASRQGYGDASYRDERSQLRSRSRSIRRRRTSGNDEGAAGRYRSRSPYRPPTRDHAADAKSPTAGRKRNLSPYSQRMALSEARG